MCPLKREGNKLRRRQGKCEHCCVTKRRRDVSLKERKLEGCFFFLFFSYGLHSRALLKPLKAGYLSYYVIRLAGTPNESCGNLSALWIAPFPATIYQVAPHLKQSTPSLNTHIHRLVTAGVVGLGEMDPACNGIPMLNTPPSVFYHLGVSTLLPARSPRGKQWVMSGFFFVFFLSLLLSITIALPG